MEAISIASIIYTICGSERIIMVRAKGVDYSSVLELRDLLLVKFRKGKDGVHPVMFLNVAQEFCDCTDNSWGFNQSYVRGYLKG